ncbi:DUF6367 family protein [Klebsiella pneumoniae]|uniref:DUF6367 family protein n=1 Tax=Klebsiella pneumoniae TaxID=573 RepID=UPI001561B8BB|nr:DUF6367 family protein [Klebsiella pneumoniae]MBZ1538224.1 hypothetical protein [Klebsiella pneumoniae]QKI44183.1 hypothetical protein FVP31_07290 [Klebsiella pneumoniae]HBX5402340.1 hypothetical protein [Klebsiella pneumoniae]
MSILKEIYDELPEDYVLTAQIILNNEVEVLNIATESWKLDPETKLYYRVDAENTNTKTQRHIHIAAKKHKSSKSQQVSWNADASRHDSHSFNDNFSKRNAAEKLAKKILKIGPNISLEAYQESMFEKFLTEVENNDNDQVSIYIIVTNE